MDRLGHVAFGVPNGVGKIIGVIGGTKARQSGIVTSFDILEPGRLDRKA